MRQRIQVAGAVILAAFIMSGGLLLYPFSVADPQIGGDAEQAFATGNSSAYEIRGAINMNRETFIRFEGAVSNSDEQYQRIVSPGDDMVTEMYQENASVVYHRFIHPSDDAGDQRIEMIKDRSNQELVSVTIANGTYDVRYVETDPSTSVEDDLAGTGKLIMRTLQYTHYEQVGTATDSKDVVFEPQNGWYEGSKAYRVTESSGSVQVDPDKYVATSVNVSWALTTNTDSYLHYLVNRENTVTQEFTYEYIESNPDVEPPVWVTEIRNTP